MSEGCCGQPSIVSTQSWASPRGGLGNVSFLTLIVLIRNYRTSARTAKRGAWLHYLDRLGRHPKWKAEWTKVWRQEKA